MWPLKTILYFALFWIACLMALVNPIWGVMNYMMAYQTNPSDTWWGAPLVALGMRFSMLAAVFTILGMFLGRKYVPHVRPGFCLWELGLLLMVGSGAISLFIGYGIHTWSLFAFEKLWKMLLFVFILCRLATTRQNLRLVIWCFVAGSLYIGWDAFTAPASAFWLGRLELIGGPDFSSTSGTAAHLAAMLPIIGVAFLITGNWTWRVFAAVSGALSFNAIILCRTRSAFVGLLCGALAAGIMVPRARRYRIYVLMAAGGLAAFSLTDNHFWARMSTLADREALAKDSATISRMEIWGYSAKLIVEHPGGVGPGNFRRVVGKYNPAYYNRSAHNTVIICFTELGVHGGIVFLLLVCGSLRYLYLSARLADLTDNPLETKLIAYGFLISFTTYFVTGLGTERLYCESFWWILALPLCLYRVVMHEVTAEEVVPELARSEPARFGFGEPVLHG